MTLQAQTVTVHFPRFAGKDWYLLLPQGGGGDTVQRGAIPPDGWIPLTLPDRYKGYRGMARWMLKQGGGLDFVWAGESFTVECLSDQPNEDNIIYKGSDENSFLLGNFRAQDEFVRRYAAMNAVLKAYHPVSGIAITARQEKQRLEKEYREFRGQLAASPLYAARFREIVDLTRGMGNLLTDDEQEKANEINQFIARQLDWSALYNSNHWSGIIYSWAQMNVAVIKNDTVLLESARRILSRLDNPEQYTSFCEHLVRAFVQTGKDSLLSRLSKDVKNSGKLLRADGLLAQFGALQPGELAPDLAFEMHIGDPAAHNHQTKVIRPRELSGQGFAGALLVFYQSGCGPCESTMQQLAGNYILLRQKGIRVISISADTNNQIFENTANGFPWMEKYRDEDGIRGPNFRRYGVAGTPTLFVVDAMGKVLLRTAQLESVLEWQRSLPVINPPSS